MQRFFIFCFPKLLTSVQKEYFVDRQIRMISKCGSLLFFFVIFRNHTRSVQAIDHQYNLSRLKEQILISKSVLHERRRNKTNVLDYLAGADS